MINDLIFKEEDIYELPTIAILNSYNEYMDPKIIDRIDKQITIHYKFYEKKYITFGEFRDAIKKIPEEWILFKDNSTLSKLTILKLQRKIIDNPHMEVCFFPSIITKVNNNHIQYFLPPNKELDIEIYQHISNVFLKKSILENIILRYAENEIFDYFKIVNAIIAGEYTTTYDTESIVTNLEAEISINFIDGKNKIAALSHELSVTGAPIVFLEGLKVLIKEGYNIMLYSPINGPMLQDCLEYNIPVVIHDRLFEYGESDFIKFKEKNFDIFVNTICLTTCVNVLNDMDILTYWWIHDAEGGYEYCKAHLPKVQHDKLQIYSAGNHAMRIMHKYAPQYRINNLIYGIRYDDGSTTIDFPIPSSGKKVFCNIATLETRKGQDLLCDAIEKLPIDIVHKCFFLFVGKPVEVQYKNKIIELTDKYPENVMYLPYVPHASIYSVFNQSDCVVCVSRDDPMPVFVTEGFMLKVPTICSENTGTASLIEQGVEGFVYKNNDPNEISKYIVQFMKLTDTEIEAMGDRAKKLFFKHFEISIFEKNLLSIFNKV